VAGPSAVTERRVIITLVGYLEGYSLLLINKT